MACSKTFAILVIYIASVSVSGKPCFFELCGVYQLDNYNNSNSDEYSNNDDYYDIGSFIESISKPFLDAFEMLLCGGPCEEETETLEPEKQSAAHTSTVAPVNGGSPTSTPTATTSVSGKSTTTSESTTMTPAVNKPTTVASDAGKTTTASSIAAQTTTLASDTTPKAG